MSYNVEIFDDMLGVTFIEVTQHDDDQIIFKTANGETWEMMHHQDCCEHVSIDDVVGDLSDLVGYPLVQAEEVSSRAPLHEIPAEELMWMTLNDTLDSLESRSGESETWTFYKFATIKGSVNIRWYGSSNGYYSESVSLYKTNGE